MIQKFYTDTLTKWIKATMKTNVKNDCGWLFYLCYVGLLLTKDSKTLVMTNTAFQNIFMIGLHSDICIFWRISINRSEWLITIDALLLANVLFGRTARAIFRFAMVTDRFVALLPLASSRNLEVFARSRPPSDYWQHRLKTFGNMCVFAKMLQWK